MTDKTKIEKLEKLKPKKKFKGNTAPQTTIVEFKDISHPDIVKAATLKKFVTTPQ